MCEVIFVLIMYYFKIWNKRWSKGYSRIERAVGKVQSIWHRDGYHQNWTVGLNFNFLLQHNTILHSENLRQHSFEQQLCFLSPLLMAVIFQIHLFNLLIYIRNIKDELCYDFEYFGNHHIIQMIIFHYLSLSLTRGYLFEFYTNYKFWV